MQDPERYLVNLKIAVPCAVQTKKPAMLDSTHRAFVNHEVFFFSSDGARTRFLKNPLRYAGLVTDPVSRARFQPTPRSPRTEYRGRPYFFSSDATRLSFEATPDSFAFRKGM